MAIGNGSFQTKVDSPLRVRWLRSWPLEMTLRPAGTVARIVQVALSAGWSLIGIHVEAALGSSPMKAPSKVWTKP